jgi:hypothetical protein
LPVVPSLVDEVSPVVVVPPVDEVSPVVSTGLPVEVPVVGVPVVALLSVASESLPLVESVAVPVVVGAAVPELDPGAVVCGSVCEPKLVGPAESSPHPTKVNPRATESPRETSHRHVRMNAD